MYIQNHISDLDLFITWVKCKGHPSILGKKEGLAVPGMKYLIGPLNCLLVSQEKKDTDEERSKLF